MSLPQRLKQSARKALRLFQKRNRNRLEIVLYHFVTAEENPFATAGHNVEPDEFERQLDHLLAHYEVLPLDEASKLLENGAELSKPAACVCFDDGYKSNLTEAYPILQRKGVPAIIFVCPSVLGNADLLWRDKVRYLIDRGLEDEFVKFLRAGESRDRYAFETLGPLPFYRWSKSPRGIADMTIQADLQRFFEQNGLNAASMAAEHDLFLQPDDVRADRDGLTFANHTWSHPLMTQLGREAQHREILTAHEWLAQRGIACKMLALPFTPFNEDTVSILADLNYACLHTVYAKSNHPGPSQDAVRVLHRWLAPATISEFRTLF